MQTHTDLAKLAATNFGTESPAPTEGATSETTNPAPMDTSDDPTPGPDSQGGLSNPYPIDTSDHSALAAISPDPAAPPAVPVTGDPKEGSSVA